MSRPGLADPAPDDDERRSRGRSRRGPATARCRYTASARPKAVSHREVGRAGQVDASPAGGASGPPVWMCSCSSAISRRGPRGPGQREHDQRDGARDQAGAQVPVCQTAIHANRSIRVSGDRRGPARSATRVCPTAVRWWRRRRPTRARCRAWRGSPPSCRRRPPRGGGTSREPWPRPRARATSPGAAKVRSDDRWSDTDSLVGILAGRPIDSRMSRSVTMPGPGCSGSITTAAPTLRSAICVAASRSERPGLTVRTTFAHSGTDLHALPSVVTISSSPAYKTTHPLRTTPVYTCGEADDPLQTAHAVRRSDGRDPSSDYADETLSLGAVARSIATSRRQLQRVFGEQHTSFRPSCRGCA